MPIKIVSVGVISFLLGSFMAFYYCNNASSIYREVLFSELKANSYRALSEKTEKTDYEIVSRLSQIKLIEKEKYRFKKDWDKWGLFFPLESIFLSEIIDPENNKAGDIENGVICSLLSIYLSKIGSSKDAEFYREKAMKLLEIDDVHRYMEMAEKYDRKIIWKP